MTAEGNLEGSGTGIGKMLMSGRFEVPHHQRDFSWTKDELGKLFDDIVEARRRGDTVYFLGLMVFMQSEAGTYIVLDGQQRLASTVLILSAIRSWIRQYDKWDRDANKISEDYIGERELGEDTIRPRLTLNENNNSTFIKYIVEARPPEDVRAATKNLKKYDANRPLLDAAVYARLRVEEIANSQPSIDLAVSELFSLVIYIRDSARVVRLVVPSESDAYTVFETLNDRGLDLSVLDLVKNHLFGKADGQSATQLRDMKVRWSQMMSNLSAVRGDDFLRAFWTSRNGRVRISDVFPDLKKRFRTSTEVIALSEEMLGASEHYAALHTVDDPLWSELTTSARESLKALRIIGFSQAHPMLLAGMERLSPREMERLLRFTEVLLVRYQLIGGGSTGQLETACAKVAHSIFAGKLRTATEVSDRMQDIFPNDREFRDAFTLKQERSNAKARYILRRIEDEARRRNGGQQWDSLEPAESLTVEHILPRNPSDDWHEIVDNDPAIVEECVFRLGNLTLLNKVNRELGAKGFERKKVVFCESPLATTRHVATVSAWDRVSIEERQRHLAEYALQVWRFT